MTVEILTPANREEWLELRKPTLGGTETPAMLGVHPRMTPFELWAKKSDLVPPLKDNKRLRRGRLLEPVGIELLREERPEWIVKANPIPGGEFYRDLDAGLSCTPDAFLRNDGWTLPDGLGTCNIKTVESHVFRKDWMLDGKVQLPPYVAIQAMQEMHLTGASWACVFAVVGFDLDTYLIEVKVHHGVIARIKREVQDFLRRIRENDPPDPDYGRDGDVIADLYADDDGGSIDLAHLEVEPYNRILTLLERREQCKEFEGAGSEAAKQRKTIDAELIHLLGNASRGVLVDGRIIEAKTVRRKGFTVEPTTYRAVKIKSPARAVA